MQAAPDEVLDLRVAWPAVFAQSAAAMALIDLDGRYVHVNEALCRLTGYTREQLLQRDFWQLTHPDDRELGRRVFEELLRGTYNLAPFEKRYLLADGRTAWVMLSTSLIHDDAGEPRFFLSVVQDVTDGRELGQLWQRSFDHAPIGMSLVDLSGRWKQVNNALCDMLGYSRAELLTMGFADVTVAGDESGDAEAFADLSSGRRDSVELEKRYRHRDGHPLWVLIRATAVPGSDGRPAYFVAQYEDVGERRMADAHLAHLALHDPLTGLANRALLADRMLQGISMLVRAGGVLAVLVVDVDGLKQVNDEHGHAAGDQLLIRAARELEGAVRDADTVARLGGDEFVVVGNHPDVNSAQVLARRLRRRLDLELVAVGSRLRLRASVGVATTSDPHASAADLLEAADRAMYVHKRRHRSGAVGE